MCAGVHTCACLPCKAPSCSLGWFQFPTLSCHTKSCVGTRTLSEPCPQNLSGHPGATHSPNQPCSPGEPPAAGASAAPLLPQLLEVTSAREKGDKGDQRVLDKQGKP